MSQNSSIEWTDATWNPVRGCVKVSPGCANCYAETFAERFRGVKGHPYEQGFDLRLVPDKLTEPLSWKKPRRVFVNSMSDLFQDGVSDEYIDQVFAVMAVTPQHAYQVLTKRAERMRDYMIRVERDIRLPSNPFPRWRSDAEEILNARKDYTTQVNADCPLPNVWLGVSVENQHFADERIPLLLQTPATVRFISAEPLLESVDLFAFIKTPIRDECLAILNHIDSNDKSTAGLDWVIIGGESGHGARPFDLAWARSIVGQCKAAGVQVFVKQLGTNPVVSDATCSLERAIREGGYTLKSRKGGDMAEWPEDLRVREFPSVQAA